MAEAAEGHVETSQTSAMLRETMRNITQAIGATADGGPTALAAEAQDFQNMLDGAEMIDETISDVLEGDVAQVDIETLAQTIFDKARPAEDVMPSVPGPGPPPTAMPDMPSVPTGANEDDALQELSRRLEALRETTRD